jgi:hypothetical protein
MPTHPGIGGTGGTATGVTGTRTLNTSGNLDGSAQCGAINMKRQAMPRPPKSSGLESMEFRGRTLTEVESEYKEWRSAYRDKYRVTKKHQPKRVDA